MPQIIKPDFTYKWASGGAAIAPTNVKIQTGWTAEVPPFQWENWSQNRQDLGIAHILQHGIAQWDALTEYQYSTNGVKSVVQGSNGVVYRAKQLNTGNNPIEDLSNTYWEIAYASQADVTAATTIASVAQAQALTANNVLISPLRLADSFKGVNQSLTANGYQKIPGGLIIQWGSNTEQTTNNTTTLPIAFPTACVFAGITDQEAISGQLKYAGAYSLGKTTVSFVFNGAPGDFRWIAIGY